MNKAITFMRLDFLTVKPYFTLKNLALMVAAPMIIMITSGNGAMFAGMFVIFGALYVSYPFVISEKNGMDALYATLSIGRGTVVIGRYLFALAFNVCAMLLGLAAAFVMDLAANAQMNIAETLLTSLALFAVVSLIEAVQLPIYFKLGYEKAKLMAYLPYVILWLGTLAIGSIAGKSAGLPVWAEGFINSLAANPYLAAILAAAVWLGLMFASCGLSRSFYGKRDF